MHLSGTTSTHSEFPAPLETYALSVLASATDNWSEERVIGSGGFGDVYEATIDGKKCAVKRLHTVVAKHFKREVRKMSRTGS